MVRSKPIARKAINFRIPMRHIIHPKLAPCAAAAAVAMPKTSPARYGQRELRRSSESPMTAVVTEIMVQLKNDMNFEIGAMLALKEAGETYLIDWYKQLVPCAAYIMYRVRRNPL